LREFFSERKREREGIKKVILGNYYCCLSLCVGQNCHPNLIIKDSSLYRRQRRSRTLKAVLDDERKDDRERKRERERERERALATP